MCGGGPIVQGAQTAIQLVSAITGASSLIGTLSGKQKMGTPGVIQAPAPPTEPSKPSADKVSSAAEDERRRLLSRGGRASTIATSGLGIVGTAPTTMRTLLGGQ